MIRYLLRLRAAATAITLACFVGLNCVAQDKPPAFKSEKLQEAQRLYESEVANAFVGYAADLGAASINYNKAIGKARSDLIAQLEIALETTTQSGDLDEALLIRQRIAPLQKAKPEEPNLQRELELAERRLQTWRCGSSVRLALSRSPRQSRLLPQNP